MSENYPNYTENVPLMSENNWKSDSSFTYSLLSGLYEVAEDNLKSMFPDYKDMATFKLNEEDLLDFSYWGEDVSFNDIVNDAVGPATYIGVWTVLGIIFTITGIVWCALNKCCCCCKGKKSDLDFLVSTDIDNDDNFRLRLEGFDKGGKKKKIYKIITGIFMGLFIIGYSFSIFMSFVSNETLRTSIFELYNDVVVGLDDADKYINITNKQINAVFVTSFGNLSNKIICPGGLELATESKAYSDELWSLSETLISAITNFRNDVNFHSEPDSAALGGVSHSLGRLQKNLFDSLGPFLQKIIDAVGSMQNDCENAKESVKMQLRIDATTLTNALNDIPIDDIRDEFKEAEDDFLKITGSAIYGTFMGFNVIMLMVLIGVVIGSLIVWIGKASAKKTGFIFYRFSIVIMFAFGWIVLLAMISQYGISGMFTQIVCKAVRDLENNSTTFKLKNNELFDGRSMEVLQGSNPSYIVPTYRHIMSSCKNDQSAFNTFKLDQVFDLESIKEISDKFNFKIKLMEDEFYIKELNSVYSALSAELRVLETHKSRLIEVSSEAQFNRLEYLLISIMNNLKTLENGDIIRNMAQLVHTVVELVDNYEMFVYEQTSEHIGKCQPMHRAVDATIHTLCYKLLGPVATYWWSLQFVLIMFVAIICTALISERVFKN